ncbi:MAG: hypothetical protein ACPGQV_14095 [Alphaproteobacteria bacterium]
MSTKPWRQRSAEFSTSTHLGSRPAKGRTIYWRTLPGIYLGPATEMLRSENGYPKAPNYAFANDAKVVLV